MDSIIIFLARDLIFILILLFLFVWIKLPSKLKKELAIALLLAGAAAYLLTKIAGALYYHPRPFVAENIKPLISHGNDNGFPSEHTVLAATLTALIYYYRRNLGWIALILTLAIGAGRVWADVHSPIDILAGLIIGLAAGVFGYQISSRYFNKPAKTRIS